MEQIKIVGYILWSDMKTISNIQYIIIRAYCRMWIVWRLTSLEASHKELIDVLEKQVLSVLYLWAPAWYSLLIQAEIRDLNHVLKCGLWIIYWDFYNTFAIALVKSGIISISEKLQKKLRNLLYGQLKIWSSQNGTRKANKVKRKD